MPIQRPIKELPKLYKRTHVTIDSSITDSEILGIVSALIGCKVSADLKHESICKQLFQKQELDFTLFIDIPQVMVDKGLPELLKKLLPCEHYINHPEKGFIDIEQTLDYNTLYELAKPSGRAFAQVAGILIGAEAPAVFDLSPATIGMTKEIANLALLGISTLDKYVIGRFILDKILMISQFISATTDERSYKDMIEDVVNASIVIAERSFYTYAAACLNIPCIEIFKTREELKIHSKWSSNKYAAILEEELEHVTIERLQTFWQQCNTTIELSEQAQKEYVIMGGADGA